MGLLLQGAGQRNRPYGEPEREAPRLRRRGGGDQFGFSVSLSGDSALVGARQNDGKVAASGSAYYFKGLDGKTGLPDGYTGHASVTTATYESVKLLASDGAKDDYFGTSVSLSGDSALVGAFTMTTRGPIPVLPIITRGWMGKQDSRMATPDLPVSPPPPPTRT
ncbi:hypothetical protein Ga0100231_006620 [Opitutaceae bacterium TAV4]|nr:hypothetical protein Ga0100231_006620 [Opitutaceae bacterium TAV4]